MNHVLNGAMLLGHQEAVNKALEDAHDVCYGCGDHFPDEHLRDSSWIPWSTSEAFHCLVNQTLLNGSRRWPATSRSIPCAMSREALSNSSVAHRALPVAV